MSRFGGLMSRVARVSSDTQAGEVLSLIKTKDAVILTVKSAGTGRVMYGVRASADTRVTPGATVTATRAAGRWIVT